MTTIKSNIYDPRGQASRRKAMVEQFTAARVNWFNDEGDWVGPENREPYFWTAWMYISPFMMSGNPTAIARANAMMEKGRGWPVDLLHELIARRDLMTDKAVSTVEPIVEKFAREKADHPHSEFVGDNDNHPLAFQAAAALWGTYSGDKKIIETARSRYNDFKRLLTRRGLASEYTAPGYTSMQLRPAALVAEFGPDENLRTIARDIETRLWLDFLGHWHFPSRSLCGAHTRAVNFLLYWGSFAQMHLHLALGDKAIENWSECWQSTDDWRAIGCEMFLRRTTNMACVPYHCPAWLAEWALNRQYPYQMLATADGCPSYATVEPGNNIFAFQQKGVLGEDDDLYEYPAWHTRVATYMTEDYGIGTSQRSFSCASQFTGFSVTMPAKTPFTSLEDTVRIFSRYVVNETEPFVTNTSNHNPHVKKEMGCSQTTMEEMGRFFALQHERTAMVIYHPRVHVAQQATSMKAAIFIPNAAYGEGACRADEIYIGEQKVDNFEGESPEPASVFIRIAETYMAFIPLILNHENLELEREVAVRIRPEGKALAISFYNYQGPPLDLDRRQCSAVGNGFVCEMGSTTEDGSFETFRKRFADIEIDDRHDSRLHTRGAIRRQTLYRRAGLELAMEYNPASEGIRYQTINGKIAPEPMLEATELDLAKVPWVEDAK